MIRVLDAPNVCDRFNEVRIVVDGDFGFIAFRIRFGSAKREADRSDDFYSRIFEQVVNLREARRVDTNAAESQLAGAGADTREFVLRDVRMEQEVIDETRKFLRAGDLAGQGHRPIGCHAVLNSMVSRIQ